MNVECIVQLAVHLASPSMFQHAKVKQFLPYEVGFTSKNNNSFRKLYFEALRNSELLNVQSVGQHHLSTPPLQMVQSRSVLFILVDFYSFGDCIMRRSGDMVMLKLVPLR